MIDDRELVFGRIRSALERPAGEGPRKPDAGTPPPIPDIAGTEPGTLLERFKTGVIRAAGSFDQVDDWSGVPEAVARYLRQHNLALEVTAAPDARLGSLEWGGIEFGTGAGDRHMETGISMGFAGLAESGTVAQVSGPSSPPLLAFAPATNIMVLERANIVGGFEGLWRKLRNRYGESPLAPTINLITGPSRTGDIEQVLYLGAHGPVRYHVIVVGHED